MIIDTSAIVAMLRDEPEAGAFLEKIVRNGGGRISAGSWVEFGPVLAKFGADDVGAKLAPFCASINVTIAPVTAQQAEIGRQAYAEYGKGNHKARLNFGDCFAYALAKATGEPMLFKGDDFIHTDIAAA